MVNSVKTKQEILEEFREQWRQEVHARGKDPSIVSENDGEMFFLCF